MPISAYLIPIGNELLAGDVTDTNSSYVATELKRYGISVAGVSVVPDNIEDIISAIHRAFESAELVMLSGGLGPTSDDRTRDAVAQFLGVPLVQDPGSHKRLEEYSRARGRKVNKNRDQQTFFPQGSVVLENEVGTADAFRCDVDDTRVLFSLPGVPRELRAFVKKDVLPWAEQSHPLIKPRTFIVGKCFGLSESYIGSVIDELKIAEAVDIGYRPRFPQVRLTFSSEDDALVRSEFSRAKEAIGPEFVYTEDPKEEFPDVVARLLSESGKTIAFAESCSGGAIANEIVSVEGSSRYFLGSVVSYANSAKQELLGVQKETLQTHGAVSPETAIELARGVRERSGADIAVSTTGVAGPGGGTDEKPVGRVYFGFVSEGIERAIEVDYPTERNAFRKLCAFIAQDLIRRHLLGYSLEYERR